jgi:hypothetical protein
LNGYQSDVFVVAPIFTRAMMESEECAADGHPPKTGSAATRATPVEDQFVIFHTKPGRCQVLHILGARLHIEGLPARSADEVMVMRTAALLIASGFSRELNRV